MGDRATIRIKHSESDTAIHLYTHWRGSEVNTIVADALQRATQEGRITDDAYCTRIISSSVTPSAPATLHTTAPALSGPNGTGNPPWASTPSTAISPNTHPGKNGSQSPLSKLFSATT